jgi:uncharacterized protein YbjT (DUF2867 family)
MRIVIVGGTGHVGKELARLLSSRGHSTLAASPKSGVDAITGKGLVEALAGAQVLVDTTEAPSLEEQEALDFFVASSNNLVAAAATAGIEHQVVLSIVGVDRIGRSGYFRAKFAQEEIVKTSGVPYTIVRSTQFFDLIETLQKTNQDSAAIRVSPALIRPIAAEDVAEALADIAVASPSNGTVELAGPEMICLDELVRLVLSARGDPRDVIRDPQAPFFGAVLGYMSLMPGPKPQIGRSKVRDWLRHFISSD